MRPTTTQLALEAFHVNELVRFYDSQKHHGKKYLADTLAIWKQNSKSGPMQRAYLEAVRRIDATSNN